MSEGCRFWTFDTVGHYGSTLCWVWIDNDPDEIRDEPGWWSGKQIKDLSSIVDQSGVLPSITNSMLRKWSVNDWPMVGGLKYLLENTKRGRCTTVGMCECFPPYRGPACQHVHGSRQPEKPYRAILHYLVDDVEADVTDLTFSLPRLWERYNRHHDYEVVLFHDGMSMASRSRIVESSLNRVWFAYVEDFKKVDESVMQKKKQKARLKEVKWSIGYRGMCKFRSGTMFFQPVMEFYEYAMTLDTDGYFPQDLDNDPIERMWRGNYTYTWSHLLPDQPGAVRHFWSWSLMFFQMKQIDWRSRPLLQDFIRPEDLEWNYNLYMNDIEINKLSFFRSDRYQEYFRYLDSFNGFFLYRWGDHALRTIAVGMYLEPADVMQMKIPYGHQGYCQCLSADFKCYTEERYYGEMGNFTEKPEFFRGDWRVCTAPIPSPSERLINSMGETEEEETDKLTFVSGENPILDEAEKTRRKQEEEDLEKTGNETAGRSEESTDASAEDEPRGETEDEETTRTTARLFLSASQLVYIYSYELSAPSSTATALPVKSILTKNKRGRGKAKDVSPRLYPSSTRLQLHLLHDQSGTTPAAAPGSVPFLQLQSGRAVAHSEARGQREQRDEDDDRKEEHEHDSEERYRYKIPRFDHDKFKERYQYNGEGVCACAKKVDTEGAHKHKAGVCHHGKGANSGPKFKYVEVQGESDGKEKCSMECDKVNVEDKNKNNPDKEKNEYCVAFQYAHGSVRAGTASSSDRSAFVETERRDTAEEASLRDTGASATESMSEVVENFHRQREAARAGTGTSSSETVAARPSQFVHEAGRSHADNGGEKGPIIACMLYTFEGFEDASAGPWPDMVIGKKDEDNDDENAKATLLKACIDAKKDCPRCCVDIKEARSGLISPYSYDLTALTYSEARATKDASGRTLDDPWLSAKCYGRKKLREADVEDSKERSAGASADRSPSADERKRNADSEKVKAVLNEHIEDELSDAKEPRSEERHKEKQARDEETDATAEKEKKKGKDQQESLGKEEEPAENSARKVEREKTADQVAEDSSGADDERPAKHGAEKEERETDGQTNHEEREKHDEPKEEEGDDEDTAENTTTDSEDAETTSVWGCCEQEDADDSSDASENKTNTKETGEEKETGAVGGEGAGGGATQEEEVEFDAGNIAGNIAASIPLFGASR
eukprot:g2899.t1